MNTTTNTTNYNSTIADNFNFAGRALRNLCPDTTDEQVQLATMNHLDPFQLLLGACLVVGVLSLVPLVKKLFIGAFDVTGDGKVDMDDVIEAFSRLFEC